MSQDRYQIGEVAERVGLSLRTIRHYEEVGLVPPSGRTAGGFRLYSEADVARLRLVKHMKLLELSLEEMRDLLKVREALAREPSGGERDRLAERLAMYAEAAEQQREKLREHLDTVTSIAGMLRKEALARGSHRLKQ